MTDFNPQEEAVLTVNGIDYKDWETVWVQHRLADAFSYFRFTAVERDPVDLNAVPYSGYLGNDSMWSRVQFAPGNKVFITLGGFEAMNGTINTRQVAYNATSHRVELIGKSFTSWGYKSSVDTPTGSFDGQNFEQIARAVLAGYEGQIIVVGNLDATPFKKMQNQPGETIWDFLERLAREKGVILGSDHKGNYLLIGDHTAPIVHELIEGQNIKQAQFIFHIDDKYINYDVTSQTSGDDSQNGSKATEMRARADGKYAPLKSLLITPATHPAASIEEVKKQADNEALWHEGTIVSATITVQGWLRGGTDLWRVGDNVFVKSPMAPVNQTMKIQNATFTQDNQTGTQTQLELVMPWLLKDKGVYNVNDTTAPAPSQTVPSPAPTAPAPTPPASSRTPPTFGRGS
jgi:prophage tail gpP-like protein